MLKHWSVQGPSLRPGLCAIVGRQIEEPTAKLAEGNAQASPAVEAPGIGRGREGRLSPQPPGPGPRRDPLTLARGSGSTARGGRGGPCQTGGRGRAGGRPEAEGPQRPARPPTAPGPRGPAKPAAARARPPARPVNTGPRERINRQGGPRGALPDRREREGGGKAGGRGPAAPRPGQAPGATR